MAGEFQNFPTDLSEYQNSWNGILIWGPGNRNLRNGIPNHDFVESHQRSVDRIIGIFLRLLLVLSFHCHVGFFSIRSVLSVHLQQQHGLQEMGLLSMNFFQWILTSQQTAWMVGERSARRASIGALMRVLPLLSIWRARPMELGALTMSITQMVDAHNSHEVSVWPRIIVTRRALQWTCPSILEIMKRKVASRRNTWSYSP